MNTHRISLPRFMVHGAHEDEDSRAAAKTCLSTDQLEPEFDATSVALSEPSFTYESAQAEVMMKGMGHNGRSD